MSSEQDTWKRKYRALALELEQSQKRSQDAEAQLKHLLASMTIPLKGQDAQLDQELLKLRTILQKEDISGLKSVGDNIQSRIRQQDSQREKQAKTMLSSVLSWLQQLRQAASKSDNEMLGSFEQRGHDAVEQLWQLPELLADMVAFQQPLMELAQRADIASGELSNEALVGDTELLLQRISVELLALLENLNVPLTARRQLHTVGEQVEKGVTLNSLPEVLHSIGQLVSAACSDNSKEFEVYLRTLSVKLTEVQHFLFENQREEDEVGASQLALESKVRSDVRRLSETVETSQDLGILKHAVSEQLVDIVKAMDEMRRQEEGREHHLKQRYGSLMSKVEQMEQETRRVKVHMEEERHRARTDPLTGLPNRTAYDEHIAHELERWNRYQQGFSIAVADLDLFKSINDNYGHLAGDKVLRLVGKILHKQSRRTDVVARYGGEEFVIIMPGTEVDAAKKAAEKLRKSIESSPFNFYGKPVNVTMSFGVAQIKTNEDIDKLFSRADKALYRAKQNGRNQTETG